MPTKRTILTFQNRKTNTTPSFRLKFLAWALTISGSLFNLLNFNEYPLFSYEVGLFVLGIVFVAWIAGVIHFKAGHVSFLLTGLIVVLGIDLNGPLALEPVLAIACGATIVAYFRETVLLKFIVAVFSTIALFQFLSGTIGLDKLHASHSSLTKNKAASEELPPIVHILLDSYVGTRAMEADSANFRGLRRQSFAFWQEWGFQLYDGAYSRHANTANAVPHFLSLGQHPLATDSRRRQNITLGELDYFTELKQRGYRLHSIAPDFIDLCENTTIDDCRKFRRSDLSSITRFDIPIGDRMGAIASTLLSMGEISTAIFDGLTQPLAKVGLVKPIELEHRTKLFPLASAAALEDVTNLLTNPQPGNFYFVHILLPHDPYVFTEKCTVRPRGDWLGEDGPPSNLSLRKALYREQVICTMQLLESIFSQLSAAEYGKETILIAHGDHGSRIVTKRAISAEKSISARDYAMTYSTLFAVNMPGVKPGIVKETVAIEELLMRLTETNFDSLPDIKDSAAEVILADENWIPRERRTLPEFSVSSKN